MVGIFPFSIASRLAQGSIQPHIKEDWDLFLPVKRPERGANHLAQYSAKVRNGWTFTFVSTIHLRRVTLRQKGNVKIHFEDLDMGLYGQHSAVAALLECDRWS
jgi:hypothetical protein